MRHDDALVVAGRPKGCQVVVAQLNVLAVVDVKLVVSSFCCVLVLFVLLKNTHATNALQKFSLELGTNRTVLSPT